MMVVMLAPGDDGTVVMMMVVVMMLAPGDDGTVLMMVMVWC
jgi:hypothetical protein